jgi:tetratricopeptide (TPR) repeat protein
LNTKKLAITILLALVLSTTVGILKQTFAQTKDPQKQKAETLINILENNNTSIVLAFSKLEEKNISVPEAQTAYNEGLAYANEAVSLMNQEKFSEACNKAVEAMQKFEETLQLIETVLPSDPTGIEATAEEAISLKANITRAVKYVQQLESLAEKAAKAGYNTLAIEKQLGEIKQHLENATQKLRALNLEGATEELNLAKTLVDELTEYVARLTNRVTATNSERYLQEAEVRVATAKTDIALSATLTPEAKEDALTALNNSEASLATARDLIDDSNVDDAIEELEEAKRWEEASDNAISAVAVTPSVSAANTSLTNTEAVDSN